MFVASTSTPAIAGTCPSTVTLLVSGAGCTSIAGKNGGTGETLNERLKKAGGDSGGAAGPTTEMADRLKALERENRELRQANEILRKASAYFAMAELDRRSKP